MKKPTNSDEDIEDAYLQSLRSSDAQDARRFLAFGVLALLVMGCFLGYFNYVAGAALGTDLWLSVDENARPGARVLLDVSARHPKSGSLLYPPHLELELWEEDRLIRSWSVQGELRTDFVMGDAPMRVRVAQEDRRIGGLVAEATVLPRRDQSLWQPKGERRGGAVPAPGNAGFHAVRSNQVCGWTASAVAIGGVPVVNSWNTVLVRLEDASGRPVRGARVLGGESSSAALEAVVPETDHDGVAIFRVRVHEQAYLELTAQCEGQSWVYGFEVQPVFDGLNVSSLDSTSKGLRAEVENHSLSQAALYDVRCEGEVIAYGVVARSGVVEVPHEAFARYADGVACVLQVYRTSYGRSGPRALHPFLLSQTYTASGAWAANVRGVVFERPSLRVQASDAGTAALDLWRARGFTRIRWGMGVVMGSALILWLGISVRSVARRRRLYSSFFSAEDGVEWNERRSLQYAPLLALGWGGIVLMFGGLWFVLTLMGL